MTKEKFEETVEDLISIITVSKDPKKPSHFYSAYIDDRLYRGPKGKTVWTRSCDVTNSLKHYSELFQFLRDAYTEEIYEAHPEFFEKEKYHWQRTPWVKSKYRKEVNDAVEAKINEWWGNHVQIREIIQ